MLAIVPKTGVPNNNNYQLWSAYFIPVNALHRLPYLSDKYLLSAYSVLC